MATMSLSLLANYSVKTPTCEVVKHFNRADGSWSLSEVQGLLRQAGQVLTFSKPWVVRTGLHVYKTDVAMLRQLVQLSAMRTWATASLQLWTRRRL